MNNKKTFDSFGLAGAILNIVVAGMVAIASIVLVISGIIIFWDDTIGLLYFILGIVFGSVSIITLVFNAKFLSGEYKYQKEASVLGFICLSILGSVLLLLSKPIDETSNDKNLLANLKSLKDLYDAKIINEEEYGELKRKFITMK